MNAPLDIATLRAVRMLGKRPPGFIVVTDLRFIARNARTKGLTALVVDWGKAYDLRVLHRLDVLMVVMEKDRQKAAPIGRAILEAGPRSFWAQYWTDDGEYWRCETEWIQRVAA